MRSAYQQYEGPATDCLAKSKYKLVCSKRIHSRHQKQHVIIESKDTDPLVAKFVLIFRYVRSLFLCSLLLVFLLLQSLHSLLIPALGDQSDGPLLLGGSHLMPVGDS